MISPTNIPDETLSALIFCFYSLTDFQVCGSRFFGDAKIDSDFDLVTEDQTVIPLLEIAGFKDLWLDNPNPYQDSNTDALWGKGSVQVIFTKNLKKRFAARKIIQDKGLDRHKTQTWEDVYANM